MIRFTKWQYSLGGVIALFHDSFIVLGRFSLLQGIVPWSVEMRSGIYCGDTYRHRLFYQRYCDCI
ncbi:MAG: hypothetical protein R2771_03125 [Saprospiraceae bacterium]